MAYQAPNGNDINSRLNHMISPQHLPLLQPATSNATDGYYSPVGGSQGNFSQQSFAGLNEDMMMQDIDMSMFDSPGLDAPVNGNNPQFQLGPSGYQNTTAFPQFHPSFSAASGTQTHPFAAPLNPHAHNQIFNQSSHHSAPLPQSSTLGNFDWEEIANSMSLQNPGINPAALMTSREGSMLDPKKISKPQHHRRRRNAPRPSPKQKTPSSTNSRMGRDDTPVPIKIQTMSPAVSSARNMIQEDAVDPETALSLLRNSVKTRPYSPISQREMADLIKKMEDVMQREKMYGSSSDSEEATIPSTWSDSISNSEAIEVDDTTDITSVSSIQVPATEEVAESEAPEPKYIHKKDCRNCGYKPNYSCSKPGCGYFAHTRGDAKRHEEGKKHYLQTQFMCCECPLSNPALNNPICEFCNLHFQNLGILRAHYVVCANAKTNGRVFSRKDHFIEHLREEHGIVDDDATVTGSRYTVAGAWPTQCHRCPKTFQSWDERMDHLAEHAEEDFYSKGSDKKFDDDYDEDEDQDNHPGGGGDPQRKIGNGQSKHTASKQSKNSSQSFSKTSSGSSNYRSRTHSPVLDQAFAKHKPSLALERYLNDDQNPVPLPPGDQPSLINEPLPCSLPPTPLDVAELDSKPELQSPKLRTPLASTLHPFPQMIPKDKLGKATRLYQIYKEAQLIAELDDRLRNKGAQSSDSKPPSRSHRSRPSSEYDTSTSLTSVISFDEDYDPSVPRRETVPGELTSYNGTKSVHRMRRKYTPEQRAKTALIRCIGSCDLCCRRKVPCPLAHHDIAALEKNLMERKPGYISAPPVPRSFVSECLEPPEPDSPRLIHSGKVTTLLSYSDPDPWKFNSTTNYSQEDLRHFACPSAKFKESKSFRRKADWVRHENERHRSLTHLTAFQSDPNPKADIVLVHGLAGLSSKTWSNNAKTFWPADLLPIENTANQRIFTYGYDTGSAQSFISEPCISQLGLGLKNGRDNLQRVYSERDADAAIDKSSRYLDDFKWKNTIVCDAGGGTTNLSTFKVTCLGGGVIEYPNSPAGSRFVDEKFSITSAALMGRKPLMGTPEALDLFDLIGGTSTGGLIALLLSRLRTSVPQAKQMFAQLSGKNAEEKPLYIPVTGRIGRARKGVPVHTCDICRHVKTFTRAEHLRRHQLSHQKPAYPCTLKDCERVFHRPDLLARHLPRHLSKLGKSPLSSSAHKNPWGRTKVPTIHSLLSEAAGNHCIPRDLAFLKPDRTNNNKFSVRDDDSVAAVSMERFYKPNVHSSSIDGADVLRDLLRIPQRSVDVWSLDCVYSAAWVVCGSPRPHDVWFEQATPWNRGIQSVATLGYPDIGTGMAGSHEAFWTKSIFELADAIKKLHNWGDENDGIPISSQATFYRLKDYSNSLILDLPCFLEKGRTKGGTHTYGASERHPGRRRNRSDPLSDGSTPWPSLDDSCEHRSCNDCSALHWVRAADVIGLRPRSPGRLDQHLTPLVDLDLEQLASYDGIHFKQVVDYVDQRWPEIANGRNGKKDAAVNRLWKCCQWRRRGLSLDSLRILECFTELGTGDMEEITFSKRDRAHDVHDESSVNFPDNPITEIGLCTGEDGVGEDGGLDGTGNLSFAAARPPC